MTALAGNQTGLQDSQQGATTAARLSTVALFEAQRQRDLFGYRIHLWCAMLWCACAAGPMVLVELGSIPLVVCFLIRYPRHIQLHWILGRQWASRLLLAWVGVVALSLLWTADRRLGVEELGAFRFALAVLLLWPVMDRRRHLIAALAAGLLCANLAQVAHAAGTAFGLDWLTFDRKEHRNSGWWQPVVGGTILTAAVGLHLSALLTGRRLVERGLGLLGVGASLLGVLATGTRGAWIATGLLVVVGGVWAVVGFARHRAGTSAKGGLSWGHGPLIVAVVIVAAFAGYRIVGEGVGARARAGLEEIRRAIREQDYTTDTGARILMARWAWEAYASHPVLGLGAGGFRAWSDQWMHERAERGEAVKVGVEPGTPPERLHAHPHNAAMHVAATTGSLGLLIAVALGLVVLRDAFGPASGERERGYDAGPAMALVGLLLASAFDVVQVNNQTAAVLWTLVAMYVRVRPPGVRGG